MIRDRPGVVLILAAAASLAACVPDGGRPDPDTASLVRVLEAEDARTIEGVELDVLVTAARSDDPHLRRTAVRALGRLEEPALAGAIAPHLVDADEGVRAATAEALAQAVHGADGSAVLPDLLARVETERAASVRGAIARSIGTLELEALDRRRAAQAIARLAGTDGLDPTTEVLIGAALGFEALLRDSGEGADRDGLDRVAADRLEEMAAFGSEDPDDVEAARIRALAISSLGQARRLSADAIERAGSDPHPDVRRAPLRFLGAVAPSQRPAILGRAIADPSPRVAIEALRIVAAGARTSQPCEWLFAAAAPASPPSVRVVALEALGRPCPDSGAQRELLRTTASDLTPDESAPWQPAAQALVSLARIDERSAADLLPRFVEHPNPFVRTYAATVAGIVGAEADLERLAADSSPNVRSVAIEALFSAHGHRVDDLLLDQLASDDPQLLLTAARLLAGSPGRTTVAAALMVKLERLSSARRETWRDPRLALLERIGELGDASLAGSVRPLLEDFDPEIAVAAATILRAWTGQAVDPAPQHLTRTPLPSPAELTSLERTTVALHMRGGGTIVIDLLPTLAPRNAWRFVSLARSGYFDGLTFHRWAPNFVIQGGSPGANEYSGDGPYTRDEVGGSHWRGTVGVSTRGRDTGDGQIFVNLVDNVRLDHDYTVFGFVSAGMDVVDAVLEGAVIERAEVRD
ncbi:MAG: peptidylprolyl isomerase [Longimicrobiales bacterium]